MSKWVNVYVKRKLSLDRLTVAERNMYEVGLTALDALRKRVRAAVGTDDKPATPLVSRRWKRIKGHYGLKSARDLRGTGFMSVMHVAAYYGRTANQKAARKLKFYGHLMDQMTVRRVRSNAVMIEEPTSRAGRIKARGNRDMLGLSPHNQEVVRKKVNESLGELLKRIVKKS